MKNDNPPDWHSLTQLSWETARLVTKHPEVKLQREGRIGHLPTL